MENIFIFGCGQYYKRKKDIILNLFNVIGLLDNCIRVDETNIIDGIPVMNPQNISINGQEKIFLMSVHFTDMWKQLVDLGVDPARLVFPFQYAPYFENDKELKEFVSEFRFQKDVIEVVTNEGKQIEIYDEKQWRSFLREAYTAYYPVIAAVSEMDVLPISMQFGTERGTPIDRHYILDFLKENEQYIKGDVLEIEDNTYTMLWKEKIHKSIVMDVNSDAKVVDFNGNLETGEGIRENIADCFILTQTLMYIYDLKSAACNIGKLLKKDGVALITCSGISQNSRRCMDNYGCYFNFNKDVFYKMFETEEKLEIVNIGSFGNVKTVIAHIAGMCCEDLVEKDFEPNDQYYPLIVYAVVKKNE